MEDGEFPEGAGLEASRRQLQPYLCKFAPTQVSSAAVFNCGPSVPQLDNIEQDFFNFGDKARRDCKSLRDLFEAAGCQQEGIGSGQEQMSFVQLLVNRPVQLSLVG